MFKRLGSTALVLSGLLLTSAVLAQETTTQPEAEQQVTIQPADASQASSTQQHDLGTLQAELAKVEAERQRLADQLAGNGNSEALQQLQEENQQLRNDRQAERLNAQSKLVQQRQQWFFVGGLTVAVSLLLGFVLAKGGRGKRNEWLN